MKRRTKVFFDTLKKSRAGVAVILLSFIGCAAVFFLYGLPLEGFFYAALLVLFLGAVLFAVSYTKGLSKAKRREQIAGDLLAGGGLPPADTLAEKDYQEMIELIRDELIKQKNAYESTRQDEVDYYTAWVHQIKTPIAVMRMQLGTDTSEASRELETELFRIEQYVDMVLKYIRLGSDVNDLVIKEYPLDDLIRETVRKFAPQFVAKRLRLDYTATDITVITDKKWFCCILEQILSNGIKYTNAGGITIRTENGRLDISDTGIGIASDDIPRIFEKGYTGENGRYEKRSSGLGLYLCKKAADLINIPLSVKSTVGKGSCFSLDLTGKIKK